MTPPGDPLKIHESPDTFLRALEHYRAQGFVDLRDEIVEIVRNCLVADDRQSIRAGEIRQLWSRRLKNGQVRRGLLGMVESQGNHGKTAVFQFLCLAGNDRRGLWALTEGTFSHEAREAFCREHGGIPEKRGAP